MSAAPGYPSTVGRVLTRSATRLPGKLALTFAGRAGDWGEPQATAEAFRAGWVHSGDLCRIDAEGYLYVVDRIKDVINTGGVLVASREVEDAIYEHAAVAEVAVVGLAAHRVPKPVHFVDELPENASGKLLQRELRDRLNTPAAASPS
jgi:fatty-acyl-CoA synthase